MSARIFPPSLGWVPFGIAVAALTTVGIFEVAPQYGTKVVGVATQSPGTGGPLSLAPGQTAAPGTNGHTTIIPGSNPNAGTGTAGSGGPTTAGGHTLARGRAERP